MISGVSFKESMPKQNVKSIKQEQEERLQRVEKLDDAFLTYAPLAVVLNPLGYFIGSKCVEKAKNELQKESATQLYSEQVSDNNV